MNTDENLKRIEELHQKLSELRPLSSGEIKRLFEQFAVRNTYNSNAIEGSTLTLRETALILQEGITIAERSLKEHLEAIGHKDAFNFVVELSQQNVPLKIYDIKQIHSLVLMNDRMNAGVYRRVPVMIMGASHTPPQPYLIEPLMEELVNSYNNSTDSFFDRIAKLHLDFERIHPFIDGNGRTGRLILNLELLKAGYYPVDIKCTDRIRYYGAFEDYHSTGNPDMMKEILIEYELKELSEYVKIVEQSADADFDSENTGDVFDFEL